jgi:hypothetical protein
LCFAIRVTTAILDQKDVDRPEYIRLPKPGKRCRLTGLSRTTLAELAVPSEMNGYKPPVKSVLIRKRGSLRGIRLINFDSLLDYLHSLEAMKIKSEETMNSSD